MSVQLVREYLAKFGKEGDVMEFAASSATVELAAQVVGTTPARIAKTLSFQNGKGCLLVVMAGDARADNKKFKAQFGFKPRMLAHEEALRFTGHAVGGVCPFALPPNVPVYLDVSMRRFDIIYPAAGSDSSAVRMTNEELFTCARAIAWVDVCKDWKQAE
ncbi:MAG: YbaK/EbsC family protein [Christensenellaceae bacterium]|jgi:prolyl-tRNA editing enzyme YbaK/EbsC (Cys-tRNA(Pro) deacylase)|nr:YbaK/EbsC family protein [Christensenellaceae bacterium]